MKILFLHGWRSVPGGVKPTYLKAHGHEVINPALDDDDFAAAVGTAQAEFDKHQPQVLVGCSRGGAVAMNINSGNAKLVLLCPAWKKWGTMKTVRTDTTVLHSRADDVIPFADSEELVRGSGANLIEVGSDHRLADTEPLEAMLTACERFNNDAVRRLWLIGESLPLTKTSDERNASQTRQLADRLVCLDPRHGVFPNLVMKPLFAATFSAFKEDEAEAIALLRALEAVVCDKPDRRFNLFQPRVTDQKNPLSNRFAFDSLEQRISSFDLNRDLWLIFGHQTVSGLLKWLLEGGTETTRDELKRFLGKVVNTAIASSLLPKDISSCFRAVSPTSGAGRVGFLHRLCTEYDPDNSGVQQLLRSAVEKLNVRQKYPNEYVVSLLRCTISLMHNEAYQDGRNPTGNAQAHFVRSATKTSNGDLYWQVMGHAIARRCFNRWVGEPR